MKGLIIALALTTGACEGKPMTPPDPSDPWKTPDRPTTTTQMTPPPTNVEARSSNTQTRSIWDTPHITEQDVETREESVLALESRIDALDERIRMLESRTHSLRAERDVLAKRVDESATMPVEEWKELKSAVAAAISRLESELNEVTATR